MGGQFVLASPAPNSGGTCPPCPPRDLRPWSTTLKPPRYLLSIAWDFTSFVAYIVRNRLLL